MGRMLLLSHYYPLDSDGERQPMIRWSFLQIKRFIKGLLIWLVAMIVVRWHCLFRRPLCNLRSDRAPVFAGWCFLLCWRCTAIVAGLLTMRFFVLPWMPPYPTVISILLIFPCAWDAIRQYKGGVESTNVRRVAFGFPAGCGLVLLIDAFTR